MSNSPGTASLSPRIWLVPALAAAALAVLLDQGTNQSLFLSLNRQAMLLPDAFWSVATVLGDTLTVLCLSLLFLRRRPELTVAMLLAALPATLLSHGLKDLFEMARPAAVLSDAVHVIGPVLKAGSFPSGHTTTAFVMAAVLAVGLTSVRAAVAVLVLALLAGLSRIAVGAHWPADVAGGILCGWAAGLLGIWLGRRFPLHQRPGFMLAVRLFLIGCALLLMIDYDSRHPLARPFEQVLALTVLVAHLLPGWRMEGPN